MNELSCSDLDGVVGGEVTGQSGVAYDLSYVFSWTVGLVVGIFSNPSSSIPANWHSGMLGYSAEAL